MALLSILALISLQRSASPHLELVRLWSEPIDLGVTGVLRVSGDEAITNKGVLSLMDGSLRPTEFSAVDARRLAMIGGFRVQDDPRKADGRTVVLWDEPTVKVGYRYSPGEKARFEVLGFVPGTDRVRRATEIAAFPRVRGNRDVSLLVFSDSVVQMGMEKFYDALLLSDASRSPLPFFRIFDVTRPGQGVLGVPIPKEGAQALSEMRYSPDTPLACGDPYSGQVRWRNKDWEYGIWWGPWVLAAQMGDPKIGLLDGATGRAVDVDLTELNVPKARRRVVAAGDALLVTHYDEAESHYLTECFRLRQSGEPEGKPSLYP